MVRIGLGEERSRLGEDLRGMFPPAVALYASLVAALDPRADEAASDRRGSTYAGLHHR